MHKSKEFVSSRNFPSDSSLVIILSLAIVFVGLMGFYPMHVPIVILRTTQVAFDEDLEPFLCNVLSYLKL